MASLGAVQATLEIDAKGAIASLDTLGKSTVKAADALGKLGAQQKTIDSAFARAPDSIRRFNSELAKIGLGKFKADDLFDTKGLSAEKSRGIFDGLRNEYARTIKAMMDDNRLTSWLPEKVKGGLAQAVAVFDLYRGKFRKGTALFDFANMGNAGAQVSEVSSRFAGLTKAMQGVGAIASTAAAGIALIGTTALGAVGGVSALWGVFKGAKNAVSEAESYESALRRISVQASAQGSALGRSEYDALARDFSKYANVTRAEALEVAKSLTMVGNIGQSFGSKIRKGTQIGQDALTDYNKAARMVVDFTAIQGGNFRSGDDLKKYADNLRIAFSSWDNFTQLSSNLALFTEEQQKSIEKTKAMKGEAAALAEAFGYLPENLAGAAERATTPLQSVWDNFKSNARQAFIGIADGIDLDSIAEKLGGLFDKIQETLGDAFSGIDISALINTAIAGAIDIVSEAVDWFNNLRDAALDLWDSFSQSSTVQGFADMLSEAATAAMDIGSALLDVGAAIMEVVAWVADLLHIDEVLGTIWQTIGAGIGIIGDLVSMAVDGWKLIIAGLQDLWAVVSSGEAWGALGQGIAGAIDHFRQLYEKATAFVGGIKNAIADMFSAAGRVLGFVKGRAREAANIAADNANSAAANIGTGGADVGAKIDKVTSAVDKMNKTVGGKVDSLKPVLTKWGGGNASGTGGSTRRGGGGGGRGGKSEAEKQADRDAKNADRYLKNLREQAQEINRMTKLERLRYDIESGAIVLSDEQLQKAKEFATIIDNRVRMQRQERQEIELATQALSYRREAEDASLRVSDIGMQYTMPDRLFSQMQELRGMALEYQRSMEDMNLRERQDLIGKSGEEIQEIRAKYNKMRDMAEVAYKERVQFWQMEVDAVEQFSHDIGANYQKGLLEVADWYSNLGKDIQSATESWANKAADSLASFVRTGKMDFKSLADSILDDIARIASQQLISGIISGTMSGWTGGGSARSSSGGGFWGGLMSIFKGFFGFADGGYTGAGGKHQPAGIVHAGEFVINAQSTRRIADEFGWDFLRRLNGYSEGGYVTPLPSIVKAGGTGGVVRDSDIEVNIYNQTDSQVTARRNSGGGLDVFIKQAVDAVASNISSGGNVATAIQGAYALNRGAGVQRVGF